MLMPKVIEKIKAVLDSDLTAYRIAKEVGYASANPIHKLRNGESSIDNLQLSTITEFEKLYEEMIRMINVKITKVLTDSPLRVFALAQHAAEFHKIIPKEKSREIEVIIDEDFYKTLLVNPVVMDKETAVNTIDLMGAFPYEYEWLSTMNNIKEHERVYRITDSDTADFRVSKRLQEPYR